MPTSVNQKRILIQSVLLMSFMSVFSQQDTSTTGAYENLSLQQLLNIKIVSVSKNAELLFDAPLSASVITQEDIRRAGSTTIMEALRLVPGMIVREQSNGNYDIYLRGMDNTPVNSIFDGNSTTTLVMINNRPIYNYLKGGTFWETLPVDLNDVEKIEVVRGPAAALYGPNAVSGVINIITYEIKKQGIRGTANTAHGTNNTTIANASVGYRFNNRWSIAASGNYQRRERTQTSYYEIFRNTWLENPDYMIGFTNDTIRNFRQLYPDTELAMKKYAGNAFITYGSTDKMKIEIMAGAQHSRVQKVSTENGITPLSTVVSDSRYADLRANIKKFAAQVSYNSGTQLATLLAGNKYDFKTFDANIEYFYSKRHFSLKPGFSYRSAVYDDTKYSDIMQKTGFFNAKGQLVTQSASLRAEYKLLRSRIRLVAGLMASKFNYPDTTYLSYELAATWKINTENLLRLVYSSSPRSSNIYDNYVNQNIGYYQTGPNQFTSLEVAFNKSLKLLTADMVEIGYRAAISQYLQLDIEIFHIRSRNFSHLTINSGYTEIQGSDTVNVVPFRSTNLPLTLLQQGITLSVNYTAGKILLKPFATIQHSTTRNYSPYMNTADAAANPTLTHDPSIYNINSGIGTEATVKSTPTLFGGMSLNYQLSDKWNVNTSSYYYSGQTYYHISNLLLTDGVRGVDHLAAKWILNINISFEPVRKLHLFCTGKNILGNRSREFFRADDVPFMLLAGINYGF